MVFFTCNLCGESVKKPAVEKHYQQRCRGATKNISCMDCQKDFFGEEYVAHTKCISEMEKYSGKDYVPKESKNSNAKKQESWMEIIRSILESGDYNLSPPVRNSFQRLQSVDNVPRKKAKFENFVGNCMRMPKHQATQVWDILEQELNKMKQAKQAEVAATNGKSQQNGIKREAANGDAADTNHPPQKKPKTKENVEPSVDAAVTDDSATEEFQWSQELLKIVAKHENGITLEKLKKKLLKKYIKKLSVEQLSEKQEKKFDKKLTKQLKKCDNLQVQNDVIKSC